MNNKSLWIQLDSVRRPENCRQTKTLHSFERKRLGTGKENQTADEVEAKHAPFASGPEAAYFPATHLVQRSAPAFNKTDRDIQCQIEDQRHSEVDQKQREEIQGRNQGQLKSREDSHRFSPPASRPTKILHC